MLDKLTTANLWFDRVFPGDVPGRQPVHVVYGGAHLFKPETPRRLGEIALSSFEKLPPEALTAWLGLGAGIAGEVRERVVAKLRTEPVEDFRIDFEDGFGVRSDEEEDAAAVSAGERLAEAAPLPFVGMRTKAMTEGGKRRAARTLDLFVTALLDRAGQLPAGFRVTLPKVAIPEQVEAFAELLGELEATRGLPERSLQLELMIEATQALPILTSLVKAGGGRVIGAHLGPYDLTASAGIAAPHQSLDHPLLDQARAMLKIALSGTGVALSDGPTTLLPIGEHVREAWTAHYRNVRRALAQGFWQGWDLHPAQLPIRYVATYAFFHEALPAMTKRLAAFEENASRATLSGQVFDDAATSRGLRNFFDRARACGAL
jgi:citrate lyase beta subunit